LDDGRKEGIHYGRRLSPIGAAGAREVPVYSNAPRSGAEPVKGRPTSIPLSIHGLAAERLKSLRGETNIGSNWNKSEPGKAALNSAAE